MELTVGSIFSETWAQMKSRFGILLGLMVAFFVGNLFLSGILTAIMGTSMMAIGSDGLGAMGAGFAVMMLLVYLIYFAVSFAGQAAMVHGASPRTAGDFGQAFLAGFRSILPMAAMVIILGIVATLVVLILGVITAAVGSVGALTALLVVPAFIYLACRLSVVIPIIAVDRVLNPITAIRESWRATRGNVLPIFLAVLLFVVIVVVGAIIVFAPIVGVFVSAVGDGDVPSTGMVGAIGGSIAWVFIAGIAYYVLISLAGAAFPAAIHARLFGRTDEKVAETFA